MTDDPLSCRLSAVRGADTNSLLRQYDAARRLASASGLQSQRARADRAVRIIAEELHKRNVFP